MVLAGEHLQRWTEGLLYPSLGRDFRTLGPPSKVGLLGDQKQIVTRSICTSTRYDASAHEDKLVADTMNY